MSVALPPAPTVVRVPTKTLAESRSQNEAAKADKIEVRVIERQVTPESDIAEAPLLKRKSEVSLTKFHAAHLAAPKTGNVQGKGTVSYRAVPAFANDVKVEGQGLTLASVKSPERLQIMLDTRRKKNDILRFPALADRIAVREELAVFLDASPMRSAGRDVRISLLDISPQSIESMPLKELRTLMEMLSAQKVLVRYWDKNNDLRTAHTFGQQSRDVRADAALLMAMHVRGGDVACSRLMMAASSAKAARGAEHYGAAPRIETMRSLLSDAAKLIVTKDGMADGEEMEVAKFAAEYTSQFLKSQRAASSVASMASSLSDMMSACNIHDEAQAGAFIGIMAAGLFSYLRDVRDTDRKYGDVAKTGSDFALSFLEEAPGGKVAAQIIKYAVFTAIDAAVQRAHQGVTNKAAEFVSKTKIEVMKQKRLPGAPVTSEEMSTEQVLVFMQWIGLTMDPTTSLLK